MRYEVRYNNRMWHVFDTHLYTAVDGFKLESAAFDKVAALNKK